MKKNLLLFAVFLCLFILFVVFQNFSKFESHNIFPAQIQYSSLKEEIKANDTFSKNSEFYTFITAPASATKLMICYDVNGDLIKKCTQPTDGTEIDLSALEPIQTEKKSITISNCPSQTQISFHTYRVPNKPELMGIHTQNQPTEFIVSTYVAGEYVCEKGFVEDGLLRFSHSSRFLIR